MYKLGDIVYGKVTNIVGYGAFVSIDDEYTGLIHISEFSDNYVKNINDFVKIGDKVMGTQKILSKFYKSRSNDWKITF